MPTDTDQPLVARRTLDGVSLTRRREGAPGSVMPLPSDDEEPPGETLAALDEVRAMIMAVIGKLFEAAGKIFGALLSLVQALAGRDAAEAVDRTAADAIDRVFPDLPTDETPEPTDGTPEPTGPEPVDPTPTDPSAAPPAPERAAVEARVLEILATNATPDEQSAITPQVIDAVTTGVMILTALETQFPGITDRLAGREATPDTPSDAGGGDAPDCEPADVPRVTVNVSVN